MRTVNTIIICAVAFAAMATDRQVVTWNEVVALVRASDSVGPVAVYMGSGANQIPVLVRNGVIDTHGVPFAILSASEPAINPLTNREVTGAGIQDYYGAMAGTVLFFDEMGLPMMELAMPQALHRNRPEVFNLYFTYMEKRHYRTMTIMQYAHAIGAEKMLFEAARDMADRMPVQELKGDERLVVGRNALSGAPMDPWAPESTGVFYVYSADASGRVFLAQLCELWDGFRELDPQITVVTPDGDGPDMSRLPAGFQAVLAHAPRAAIAALGPGPVIICTASSEGKRRGLRMNGFHPANVLAQALGIGQRVRKAVNRDLPYGERDEGPADSNKSLLHESVPKDGQ